MRQYDYMDFACLLLIYLMFPLDSASHTPCFPFMLSRVRPLLLPHSYTDLSHNYLTGPAVMPLAARFLDLSSNFLSGPLPDEACQPLSFDANCFTLPLGCDLVPQRQEAACNAFCGVSSSAGAAAACGGHGVCQDRNYSTNQPVLPPASVLTKGTQRKTSGNFTAAPVTLFVYRAGQALSGCGLELAFHANFTFSLLPRSGRVGFNGFAFVVSATDRVGSGAGVGYGGMDMRSMAIEFDTLQNKEHGDMSSQHVGLNIRGEDKSLAAVRSPFPLSNRKAYTAWVDYEPGDPGTIQVFLAASQEKPQQAVLERRLALCEVLQGAAERPAFFFGFVASTTVKPFQRHVILDSTVVTAYGLQLSTNTYMPAWASPFPRYVSADYRVAPSKQDSWVISDFHSWDCACWAFALVASVEAAYGIAMNAEAPRLSVESLFAAMGLTSEADKCSTGGSPTEALERLLTLPRGGVTEAGSPKKVYPIHGFERTRFKGFVGLMLAVRRQPVVVHLEASAPDFAQYDGTFKYQNPGCYTGKLNHVVLVIGYFVLRSNGSQNRIAPPFWVIRNSWGVEWGDRGHMRMDIQGGDGVCGINVLPGIYPIVKSIDCNQALPRNMVLQLGSPLLVPCTAFFYTLSGDTCWSISAQLFLTTSNLTTLNPGLDCSEPIKAGRSLCIERNATFAYTVPRCLQYGMLIAQDTCERLLLQVAGSEDDPSRAGKENATRWAELYRNNPGLICSSVIPVSASAVGSNTGVQVRGRGELGWGCKRWEGNGLKIGG
ncbi:unnamed protein product [Closterium sp. NIES-65]|nr:unnamed protein product [Closterium sp. NIES-65]